MPQPTQGSAPLSWPPGWPRTESRAHNWQFKKTMGDALFDLTSELARIGARDVVFSSNLRLRLDGSPRADQAAPADPGVAVYFTRAGEKTVLACDKWDKVDHNVLAIAKHIEAMRGQDRWGVGSLDRAFTAYHALPGMGETSKPRRAWRLVLGFEPNARTTLEHAEARFRDRVKLEHPDRGGDADLYKELVDAREDARRELEPQPR